MTALRTRRDGGATSTEPVCVPDFAGTLGVEVRYMPLTGLDGAYVKDPGPLLLLSSLRPSGRRNFTAAHELAHYIFDDGTTLEVVLQSHASASHRTSRDSRERLAQLFAGFLLMPPASVRKALDVRSLSPNSASPEDLFFVSSWFGVGYETLISHLAYSLRLLSRGRAKQLLRVSAKEVKARIAAEKISGDFTAVDNFWDYRAIDLDVMGTALLPAGTKLEGDSTEILRDDQRGVLIMGIAKGIDRAFDPSTEWAAFVRVAPQGYEGRAEYRHLKEPHR